VDLHIHLDRTVSELMTRLRPDYEKYLENKGCVTVMLDRAQYGCVESAVLNVRKTTGYSTFVLTRGDFRKRDKTAILAAKKEDNVLNP
jgi:hypothetical protein